MMKNIGIIGSTGSIGIQAVELVLENPDKFNVVFISCHNNISLIQEQIESLKPDFAVITGVYECSKSYDETKIYYGLNELNSLIKNEAGRLDLVLSSAVGFAGITPTLTALESGINVALANKESIVAAGDIMINTAERSGALILPVDSEHSAVFQCLKDDDKNFVDKITLTASGGPFRYRPSDSMDFINVTETLKHPNWDMGSKVSVDSATMMNKGLELIEAMYLFSLEPSQLDVYIHPQSVIHSMVTYNDGNTLAQLGYPDMKAPISYALCYPGRLSWNCRPLTVDLLNGLSFFKPDFSKYPCFRLAVDVLNTRKNSLMIAMNAANEAAVEAFLDGDISYNDIHAIIYGTLELFDGMDISEIDEILHMNERAFAAAKNIIRKERS